MEPTTSDDDLAQTLKKSEANHSSLERSLLFHREVAGDLIAEGYRKPAVLGYVVVGRDGRMHRTQYVTRDAAQEVADEWGSDAHEAGIDWDYRVVEIVESAQ